MHHIYQQIELTGTSNKSVEDAVAKAIKHAIKSNKHLGWFQVIETRGRLDAGKIIEWQVTVKIGGRVEEKR